MHIEVFLRRELSLTVLLRVRRASRVSARREQPQVWLINIKELPIASQVDIGKGDREPACCAVLLDEE